MVDPESLTNRAVLTTPRRAGRPRLPDGPMEKVELRIPVAAYNAACRRAIRADLPVAEIMRRAIVRYLQSGQ